MDATRQFFQITRREFVGKRTEKPVTEDQLHSPRAPSHDHHCDYHKCVSQLTSRTTQQEHHPHRHQNNPKHAAPQLLAEEARFSESRMCGLRNAVRPSQQMHSNQQQPHLYLNDSTMNAPHIHDHQLRPPQYPREYNHQPQPPLRNLAVRLPGAAVLASRPPTVYIISYSTQHIPTPSDLISLLHDLLPSPVPHLYTLFASNYHKPPHAMRPLYTGVHHKIQKHTMKDQRARRDVDRAVSDVCRFLGLERDAEGNDKGVGNGNRGGGKEAGDEMKKRRGNKEVALTTCCGAGTHRSVAVAEVIKRRLQALRADLVVKICHVHLVRTERDPPD